MEEDRGEEGHRGGRQRGGGQPGGGTELRFPSPQLREVLGNGL